MAKHGDATGKMPQAAERESSNTNAPQNTRDPVAYRNAVFMSMALTMSWQLALVVIVPIVGGHMLDDHYHKTPLLTLSGLVVAIIGVFGVLSKTVIEANQRVNESEPGEKK